MDHLIPATPDSAAPKRPAAPIPGASATQSTSPIDITNISVGGATSASQKSIAGATVQDNGLTPATNTISPGGKRVTHWPAWTALVVILLILTGVAAFLLSERYEEWILTLEKTGESANSESAPDVEVKPVRVAAGDEILVLDHNLDAEPLSAVDGKPFLRVSAWGRVRLTTPSHTNGITIHLGGEVVQTGRSRRVRIDDQLEITGNGRRIAVRLTDVAPSDE